MIKYMLRRTYKRKDKNDIGFKELKEMVNKLKNVVVLDVRSVQEYKEQHLPNSINIPLYEIEKYAVKMIPDLNSIIIVYCQSGKRSKEAIELLKKKGYSNLYNLENGLDGI